MSYGGFGAYYMQGQPRQQANRQLLSSVLSNPQVARPTPGGDYITQPYQAAGSEMGPRPVAARPMRPVPVNAPDMTSGPPVPPLRAPDMTSGPPQPPVRQFNRPSPVSPTPQTPGQAMRQPTPQVRGTDNAMKRAQQGAPPAPPTPTRGILKPGATPTVANLLEDVRAGVNDSGTIGLDRLTGAPMSVVQMQNQGRDIANQIVDESITRRALTDPRSLSPENRTGIAPINLMAEMDRRAEMEAERQAMQQRGAEWRATRPTSEQLRALQQSDREANAAMNLAKFGQRESPYQQRKAAERAEDRQRMRERMKQFEDIKYARIAMDRYGMAPTEELSLRAAMGAAPEAGMQFMAQKDLNQARRDIARMQDQTNKLKINTDRETQLKLKEMDNEARQEENAVKKMAAEGVIKDAEANRMLLQKQAETEAKKVEVLMENARGQSRVGVAQAIGAMASNPAFTSMLPPQTMRQIVGSLTGMMGVTGSQQAGALPPSAPRSVADLSLEEAPFAAQEIANSPAIKQAFGKLDNPFSIAWDIDTMMDSRVLPPEEMLQKISDYVAIQNKINPAFFARNDRVFPTLFGLQGGEMGSLDSIVAAPPGMKQQAYAQAMQKQYGVLPSGYNPQKPPVQMQRPIAPVIPVAPPMQQGRSIFDDASYMQMTEQQLRQGGF